MGKFWEVSMHGAYIKHREALDRGEESNLFENYKDVVKEVQREAVKLAVNEAYWLVHGSFSLEEALDGLEKLTPEKVLWEGLDE